MVALLGLEEAIVVLAVAPALAGLAAYPALARMDSAAAAQTALIARRAGVLEATALFAAAPRPVLERLAAETREITAATGETLIRQGDPADALYILETGAVVVRVGDRDLATLGPGSWFGEIGLLEGVPRTATVAATEPCACLRLDGGAFLDALTTAPLSSTALEGAPARYAAVRGPSSRSRSRADIVPAFLVPLAFVLNLVLSRGAPRADHGA